MPAILGTYRIHPKTNEEGIWIDFCTSLGLVGLSETQINSILVAGMTLEQFQTALNTNLQKLCETKSDQVISPPEPFHYIENGKYVTQIVLVTANVRKINPIVIGEIMIEEAASRTVKV